MRASLKAAAAAVVLAGWVASAGGPEVLKGVRYRAVTLAASERKLFKIPDVDRVTGSSGACLEETLDLEETETLAITATCESVRTSMVWLKDGTRIHMLACSEAATVSAPLKKLRAKLQGDLKKWKSTTACVRNGRVELWGWVEHPADRDKIAALVEKQDPAQVVNKVELIEE